MIKPIQKHNPQGLANVAMCCKNRNGSSTSGDGWKSRGRGIMQLTWKSNYQSFKTWYNNKYNPDKDFVSNPDLISTNDTFAIFSGLWYYKTRVIDKISIDSLTLVKPITKKINGGDNNTFFKQIYNIFDTASNIHLLFLEDDLTSNSAYGTAFGPATISAGQLFTIRLDTVDLLSCSEEWIAYVIVHEAVVQVRFLCR